MLTPWYERSRPTKRVRVPWPRRRWYATAILSAVSTASEPELVKNTCCMLCGAIAAMLSARRRHALVVLVVLGMWCLPRWGGGGGPRLRFNPPVVGERHPVVLEVDGA